MKLHFIHITLKNKTKPKKIHDRKGSDLVQVLNEGHW